FFARYSEDGLTVRDLDLIQSHDSFQARVGGSVIPDFITVTAVRKNLTAPVVFYTGGTPGSADNTD
ncbi:hypothetical protein RZS08_52760, partial [Arthrospira platensis SPKY1]|nr:hypothetical protein [Arthrospira platensis SPKY1]